MEGQDLPLDKLAKIRRKIRAEMERRTKEFDDAQAQLQKQLDMVDAELRDRLKELGSTSVKTDYGTVIMSVKTRYTTQDWDSFKQFVMQNDALDLMEKRIAQLNMKRFLEENPGLVPPGLNSDSEYVISVRKPT
jgi:predicted DNA-binding WGR domain protein